MFRKLRNRLVLINVGITSIVIVVLFTFIYLGATNSANNRKPFPERDMPRMDEEVEDFMLEIIRTEKESAARQLLIALIISGVAIELIVVAISYYLAEQAIKPVREAYDAQKVFIANASHEIKTPLAAISANLEAADIHGNKFIENIEYETNKLTSLNTELLTLARSDLNVHKKIEEIDLAENLNSMIESFTPRMKKLNFEKKILIEKKIKINREDYLQIFSILLDNAIKYADKKIRLEVSETRLEITNDGAIISKDDLPHIFDRFYQVDKSSEGVGLGLSIAKVTAERNHWDLSCNSDKKSTTFTLKY